MALPDLDQLTVEVGRRCATAGGEDGATQQPDWLALLQTATAVAGQLEALADDLVEEYVEHCRMHGCSWAAIGNVLGVTRQAVQQRFLTPTRQHGDDELDDELRRAMAAMKEAAVRHRNDYVGTEHVLWGILAGDTTATGLLEAQGASVEGIRRAIDERFGLGASKAARRIAWTPYARRAMSLAADVAADRGAAALGCADVLVGLARVGRGAAAAVLSEAGVDLAGPPTGPGEEPSSARR